MESSSSQQSAVSTFILGGVAYRLERLSFQQSEWMGDYVLFDIDLGELTDVQVHDLVRQRGPLLAAIALLPDGTTRKQKSEQPWNEIEQLAWLFRATCEFAELKAVAVGFFFAHPFESLMGMQSGAQLARLVEKARAIAMPSESPLSSSPMAMSPSSGPSAPTLDPTTARDFSNDAPSIAPPSVPS